MSSVYPQSYLLEHEVYLTLYLADGHRDRLNGLKCVCFLRPSPATIELLVQELRQPKYAEYHVCMRCGCV